MAQECPICSGACLEERQGEFRFDPPKDIPGGTIIVPNTTWEECSGCHERILPPALQQAIENECRRRLGRLTPEQVRAVRERTGLSQAQMAELLSVGEKTYTRWESGDSLHNESSDTLVRLVDHNADLFVHLKAERQPDRQQRVAEYVQSLGDRAGLAMAAHGGKIDRQIIVALRKRLLEIAKSRREG